MHKTSIWEPVCAALEALLEGFLNEPGNHALHEAWQREQLDGPQLLQEALVVLVREVLWSLKNTSGPLSWPEHLLLCKEEALTHYNVLPEVPGFLWELTRSTPFLAQAEVSDAAYESFATSIHTEVKAALSRPTDSSQETTHPLGLLFEMLLHLHPVITEGEPYRVCFSQTAGSQRKLSGSYYTPQPLVQEMLRQSLLPLVEHARGEAAPVDALLSLRICDPSCGAGYFLVAASQHLASALVGLAPSRSLEEHQQEVITHCLYGVDIQPLAVELCKLHLWLLTERTQACWLHLCRHIRCGNSICGVDEATWLEPLPDEAFGVLFGDDAQSAKVHKQAHQDARKVAPVDAPLVAQGSLFGEPSLLSHPASSALSPQAKVRLADAWCAAFVWPRCKDSQGLSAAFWPLLEADVPLPTEMEQTVESLTEIYQWFHWPLMFPEVWEGTRAGFDLIVGNPPWERVKLQEREWFASRVSEIAKARRAATRQQLIKALPQERPLLYKRYAAAKRAAEGISHFVRQSGLYPYTGRGDVNLYPLFVELSMRLVRPGGRVGLIVPTGIATDHTYRAFFQHLMETRQFARLTDFENAEGYFPDVSSRMRFCLLSLHIEPETTDAVQAPLFQFFARRIEDLSAEGRCFSLPAQALAVLNPNTLTCPIFRSQKDATLTLSLYERFPVLMHESKEEGRLGRFLRMFDITNDSAFFHLQDELKAQGAQADGHKLKVGDTHYLPLYEGKMFDQFDHRFADVIATENVSRPGQPQLLSPEEHADPSRYPQPQFWVAEAEVIKSWEKLPEAYQKPWALVFKDVTSPTNSRTCIATILPFAGVANSAPLLFLDEHDAPQIACLCAILNSFVFDYIVRQKISSLHLNYFIVKQLPVPPQEVFAQECDWAPGRTWRDWIVERVVSLVYTAYDLAPFARDCGVEGEPSSWDEERRWELRCELDTAAFRIFGVGREDAGYIMETFPVIKKRDLKEHGVFRTKERILHLLAEGV